MSIISLSEAIRRGSSITRLNPSVVAGQPGVDNSRLPDASSLICMSDGATLRFQFAPPQYRQSMGTYRCPTPGCNTEVTTT